GLLAGLAVVAMLPSAGLLLKGAGARPRRLAWLVCLLDTALITAVVAATGGARSIFTFLYVVSVTAACVLLSRAGGLTVAALSSLLYAGLVFGVTVFPVAFLLEAPQETTALEILTMFVNAGTLLVVAILAGGLAQRFHATHEALETHQRDLADLEAFKDLVFHSVTTGLVALDRRHRITAFNRAAEEITGIAAGDAVTRQWADVFGVAVPLATVEALADGGVRGANVHEVTLGRRGGAAVPARLSFAPLRAGDGARVGLIAAIEDLSTMREMEARLRQADRLASLGRMAANIAHEIRNPLASLTGAIEVLAGSVQTGEMRERLAHIVLKESGRLNDIIKGFLEYARPAPLARVPVNVAEVLDEVLVLVEHRAVPGTLKVVREFPPSLPWDLDPQQFRQAVWNLCVNAHEAMAEGGELKVRAHATPARLEVQVSDTGEGIPAADAPHIFEPFYSTKSGGTGLGLALVHRIVQDHGGEIAVHSTPGAGTVVTLALPAAHA
ncbi:MAG TPA: ATP-binding protein, partial [Methylomirabilota bacterium]|nr:ATP-binding protein [Methylomirabilota bacterium]